MRGAGGQDGVCHCPRPERGRYADRAGCARLVASHGPRPTDARRRSVITAFAECAALTSTTGAAPTGDLRQVDLAGFWPRPSLCAELRLESGFGYKLFLRFELGFGNGEIDHNAESVRDLPSR